MSDCWSTPVAPGTLAPPHAERLRELHGAVRQWIEDSAVTQKNEHIRANRPYVDLMFAFGYAGLGDHPTANALVEDARQVLRGPIPVGGGPQAEQAVTAAVVRNFLFAVFRYRVERVLAGKPFVGPLSEEVLAARDELMAKAGSGPVNNPYKLALYVIDRFREQSRIAEPAVRVDPYTDWTKHGDALKAALAELHLIHEPVALAERIRTLYQDGVAGRPLAEVRFDLLHEGLPLAARVNEALVVELLAHVPAALVRGTSAVPELPNLPQRQTELLERALFLAGHFNRTDIVTKLVDSFLALVQSKPEPARYGLINSVARQCVRNLKRIGLSKELDRLLLRLHDDALGVASIAEFQKKYCAGSEKWALALQSLLNLAGGWLHLGVGDRANPILTEARDGLLGRHGLTLQPKDYTELARAYITALGQGDADGCLGGTIELFTKLSPTKITNTWTTAQYYSRFHLNLVEDAVLAVFPAVRRQALDTPVPIVVSG
jgi:hypothetical protein